MEREKYGNALIVQDCRRRDKDDTLQQEQLRSLSNFVKHVLGEHHLKSMKLIGLDLQDYVWETPGIKIVYNILGIIRMKPEPECGYQQIKKYLSEHPPKTPFTIGNIRLTYITSSLTVVKTALLRDLVYSFLDESSLVGIYWNTLKDKMAEVVRVIYPTQKYIDSSYLGSHNSKGLFLNKSLYESYKFEKRVLQKFEGNRAIEGNCVVNSHVKAMIVRNTMEINDDSVLYLGSHNFTPAAWGTFSKDRQEVSCSNFELGCLFLPQKGTSLAKRALINRIGIEIESDLYSKEDVPFFN